MSITVKQTLSDGASPSFIAGAVSAMRDTDGVGLGDIIAGLCTPGFVIRSGLTSSATHVEEKPGLVMAVLDAAGAVQLSVLYVGVPGAGEVLVTYAAGVPTLLFGDGANTGYRILKVEAPADLAASLAAIYQS